MIDCYISGLAVIASNWKYANEYIENDGNGVIFEYKNYEDMYLKAKKMITLNNIMKYKERSQELSKNYILDKLLIDFKKEIQL